MEIIIHQAILHVLDTTMDAPVLSGGPMELTAEKNAYLQNHIEKLLASDDIRQCRPLPDSAFKNELEHNQDFVDLSCRIAGVLFDYMHAHTTIPGADLAVVDFTRDGAPWLGILKLNYKNGYTHYTETVEGAPVNSIIQQRACLPTQSGKVEEGALVDLTDYSMRLLEKKYDIDGHKEFYLSTVVFQYTTAQPEKKKLQAIQEAAVQAGPKRDLWYWNSILKTWNAKGLRSIHDVRGPVAAAGASRNIRVDRDTPSGNDILKNATRRRSLIKKPE